MNIALQLYSVREDAAKDFSSTLQEVQEMGYDGVELAGLYGHTAEEVRAALDSAGLPAISAHVPLSDILADSSLLGQYAAIGCRYVAIPFLPPEQRPNTPAFADVLGNLERIGAECKALGMTLLYHNHDFEFEKMPDGRYGLDYLYDTVSADLLQTEIDTCWVRVSGVDPAEYIRKYSGRCPVVHLKDFVGARSERMYELIGIAGDKAESQQFQFRAVGYGVQDFPPILEAAREAGAGWVVVEQDAHYEHTALEDAKLSIDYLKTLNV